LSTALQTLGAHTISATYAGDGNFSGSSSGNLTQTVIEGTSTTLSAPAITYGQQGVVTVKVAAINAAVGTPTGNVTLSVNGGSSISGTLSHGGFAFKLGVLAAGTYTLAVSYAAQGIYAASSIGGTLTVNKANQTITWATRLPLFTALP